VVPAVGAMLAAAVALGHAYQGPPFRLSYKGLGEPICFTAFGPLAVGAFYLALAAGTGGSVWMGLPPAPSLAQPGVMGAAALVGQTTTAILFTSHFHQEDGDREVGLALPGVRLVTWTMLGVITLTVFFTGANSRVLDWLHGLCWVSSLGVLTANYVEKSANLTQRRGSCRRSCGWVFRQR
jgi:1,4-dihydroxy-2-naphthoate octaprenyltransferase